MMSGAAMADNLSLDASSPTSASRKRLTKPSSMPGRFSHVDFDDGTCKSDLDRPASLRKSNSGQSGKSRGNSISVSAADAAHGNEKPAQRKRLSKRTMHRISSLENSVKDHSAASSTASAARPPRTSAASSSAEKRLSRRDASGGSADKTMACSANTSATSLMTLTTESSELHGLQQGRSNSSSFSSTNSSSSLANERESGTPRRSLHGRKDSLELIIPLNTLNDIDKHLNLDAAGPPLPASRRDRMTSSRSPSPGSGSSSTSSIGSTGSTGNNSSCSPRKSSKRRKVDAYSPSKTTIGDAAAAAQQRRRARDTANSGAAGSGKHQRPKQQPPALRTSPEPQHYTLVKRSRSFSIPSAAMPYIAHEHSPLHTHSSKIHFLFRPPSTSRIFDNDLCESMDSQEELRLANIRSEQAINLTVYCDPAVRRRSEGSSRCVSQAALASAFASISSYSLTSTSAKAEAGGALDSDFRVMNDSRGVLAVPAAANAAAIPDVDIPVVNLTLKPNVRSILKVLLVGNCGVGKSSLLRRYFEGSYTEGSCSSTAGVEIYTKHLVLDGSEYMCKIWDTAGAENAHIITQAYYKNAHAFGLVFDVTDHASFESIPSWLEKISAHGQPNARVVLVGNKSDSFDSRARAVSKEEAKQCVITHNLSAYIETSASEGVHITELIDLLAHEANERARSLASSPAESTSDYSISVPSAEGDISSGFFSSELPGPIIFKPEKRTWKLMDSCCARAPSRENTLHSDGSGASGDYLVRRDSFGIAIVDDAAAAAADDCECDEGYPHAHGARWKPTKVSIAVPQLLHAQYNHEDARFTLSPEARKGSDESFDLHSDCSTRDSPTGSSTQRDVPGAAPSTGRGSAQSLPTSSARAVLEMDEEQSSSRAHPHSAISRSSSSSARKENKHQSSHAASIGIADVTPGSPTAYPTAVLTAEDDLDGCGTPITAAADSSRSTGSSRSFNGFAESGDILSYSGDSSRNHDQNKHTASGSVKVKSGPVTRRSKSDLSPRQQRPSFDQSFHSLSPEAEEGSVDARGGFTSSVRRSDGVVATAPAAVGAGAGGASEGVKQNSFALTGKSDSVSFDRSTPHSRHDAAVSGAAYVTNCTAPATRGEGVEVVGCTSCGFFSFFRSARR